LRLTNFSRSLGSKYPRQATPEEGPRSISRSIVHVTEGFTLA